ncbi:hypothetical protein ACIBEA_20385 [Streptomyces sp. NPDC051555]|uniref:hypothetical protein n=1 Tax=Streptomyces sp. NPDC051555 TaxID=3365657 RepID=UPI0037922732
MLVALVIACEIGFWVLLAAGLALRYVAKMPRLGAAVLLCEPLLELVLLVATVVDLGRGGEPSWSHGLAALYIGYTVGFGHYTVKWLDGHAAHRFGGGPKPPGPGYGRARARHEWKLWLRTLVAAAVALGLLQLGVWYVGDAAAAEPLRGWQSAALRVAGIHGLIAASYTVFPRKGPAVDPGADPAAGSGAGSAEAGRERARNGR